MFLEDSRSASIPQCCPGCRLDALNVLETLLLNDARTSFDRMVAAGWPHDAAVDALRWTYKQWIIGRFADAIDAGCDLLGLDAAS